MTTPTPSSTLGARIATYSAGAAVGALSIASSNAAIVYVNAGNQLLTDVVTTDSNFAAYSFDLNTDGNADLRLWTRDSTGSATPFDNSALLAAPLGAGLTLGAMGVTAAGYMYPSRLAMNSVIDASATFLTLPQVSTGATVGWLADGHATGPGYTNSQWVLPGTNSGYLGLRFKIGANDHYAWLRITVAPQNLTPGTQPRAITVHEWAYENVAGVGIEAGAGAIPEPSSLGFLALGSLGLAARRRRVA